MYGSIDSLSQFTALRHMNAYGQPVIAADDSRAVCAKLSGLTQLTFLSIGSVHRQSMVIAAEDAAQLSVLTGLRQLQLQGAKLGPGTDKLEWLGALTQLTSIR
jgi:hypothetical protein